MLSCKKDCNNWWVNMSKETPHRISFKELIKDMKQEQREKERLCAYVLNKNKDPLVWVDNEPHGIIEASEVNSYGQPREIKISDKIWYYPHIKLSKFSDVFKGYKEVRTCEVAVKRLRTGITEDLKSKELEILRNTQHPNLVSYFFAEESGGYRFYVMELASFSLEIWLPQQNNTELLVKICKDIATGVNALHKLNIIHRDLKQSNVLIFQDKIQGSQPVAKICDYGISRIMNQNTNACQTTSKVGTIGFMPPELQSQTKTTLTPSFDIFSCAILFAYITTGGKHIFSWYGNTEKHHLQSKIQEGKPNWALLKDRKHTGLKNLLQVMLAYDPLKRSNMEVILEHPFFWTPEESFQFLIKVSTDIKNSGKCIPAIQREAKRFLPNFNWKIRMHLKVQKWIQTNDKEHAKNSNLVPVGWRWYSEISVVQFINFIRDQKAHYSNWKSTDLESEEIFGTDGSKYGSYFIKTFPELSTFLYVVLQDKKSQGIETRPYYKNNLHRTFTLKR